MERKRTWVIFGEFGIAMVESLLIQNVASIHGRSFSQTQEV